jgi:hypothetical protein
MLWNPFVARVTRELQRFGGQLPQHHDQRADYWSSRVETVWLHNPVSTGKPFGLDRQPRAGSHLEWRARKSSTAQLKWPAAGLCRPRESGRPRRATANRSGAMERNPRLCARPEPRKANFKRSILLANFVLGLHSAETFPIAKSTIGA